MDAIITFIDDEAQVWGVVIFAPFIEVNFHEKIGLQLPALAGMGSGTGIEPVYNHSGTGASFLPVEIAVSGIPALLLMRSLCFVSVDSCIMLIHWLKLGKGVVYIHLLEIADAKSIVDAPLFEVGIAIVLLSICYYHVVIGLRLPTLAGMGPCTGIEPVPCSKQGLAPIISWE